MPFKSSFEKKKQEETSNKKSKLNSIHKQQVLTKYDAYLSFQDCRIVITF